MLGLVGGLTTLAHPQAGVFMAVSIVVFLPWAHSWRVAGVRVVVAGIIGLIVITPWLLSVTLRHGLDPLLSAISSGGRPSEGLLGLLSFRLTEMEVLDVIGVAGMVGAVLAVHRRDLLLPAWLVVIAVVDSRAGSTYAMVPLSMLAAYAVMAITPNWLPGKGESPIRLVARHPWRVAGAVALLAALVIGNYLSAFVFTSPLFPLTSAQRDAMAWVGTWVDDEDVFVVVSGAPSWENDPTSEWFPALTGGQSAGTVQGTEWLGSEAWIRQEDAYLDLQICSRDTLPCVLEWAATYGVAVTHVYLPKGQLHGALAGTDCCAAPRHSVELVPGARVLYDEAGATIIELP
jgi:hypothetical protein